MCVYIPLSLWVSFWFHQNTKWELSGQHKVTASTDSFFPSKHFRHLACSIGGGYHKLHLLHDLSLRQWASSPLQEGWWRHLNPGKGFGLHVLLHRGLKFKSKCIRVVHVQSSFLHCLDDARELSAQVCSCCAYLSLKCSSSIYFIGLLGI